MINIAGQQSLIQKSRAIKTLTENSIVQTVLTKEINKIEEEETDAEKNPKAIDQLTSVIGEKGKL